MSAISVKHPVVFDEFFEMGLDETVSPFLTQPSRIWGKNLHLKTALLSAFLLVVAFALNFITILKPISHLCLVSVYFFAGIPSLINSIEDLAKWEINIDVLMTLAAFLSALIGSPVEGALLLVLFSLSEAMEDAVSAKAKGAISALYKLAPTKAIVIKEDGEFYERSVKDIEINSKLLIKAGEIIPLDGIIMEGVSALNLVHLTGENQPQTKKVGDQVPAGAKNLESALILKVTHTSNDSTLAKIIKLVTEAQEARPPWQRWFDRIGKYYSMSVILLTLFFAISIPLLFSISYFGIEGSIYRSIAFLIAASPCALIIATPIAYLSAIGSCARKGILLKGGLTLDSLATCGSIAFDKTGTLTEGSFTCFEVKAIPLTAELSKAIAIAGEMEKFSSHPIAKAIVSYAEKFNFKFYNLSEFRSVPGYGIECLVEGNNRAYIGNFEFIASKISSDLLANLTKVYEEIRASGDSMGILLLGNEIFIFRCVDRIRSNIKDTVDRLKANGLKVYMLTGDHQDSAAKVSKELGINEYNANLKPEDKLKTISILAEQSGVIMVGDGINDAPALARATVGIAMGKLGSGVAVQTADVVLLQDNIELIPWLISKSHKTKRIVTQNLTLAFSVIIFATTPALLGLVPLWIAVLLHEGGTLLVGLNALRLLK